MSYRKVRSKIIYWALLIIYTAALLAAAVFALKTVWEFAERYEESMPDAVIESYIATLNGDLWAQGLSETMAAMEHPFQTDEECREVVMEILNGDIYYVRGASDEADLDAYSLRCNGSSFGTVYLKKDETKKASFEVLGKELDLPWDLRPWKVHKQEFDLSGLYTSVQVTIPSTYSVQVNGKTLGAEHVIEEGIHFDSLKDYYDVNPGLPTKCTYRADKIIGQIAPVILDESGSEYVIDVSRDDSQFLKSCTQEELMYLNDFCAKFTELYLRFSSGIMGANSSGGYSSLTAYIIPGSDLDNRLKAALDGLSWAHTNAYRQDSYQLTGAIDLGGGYYVCDVVAETTSITQGSGEKHDVNNLKIVVFNNNGDLRALSLA